MKHARILLIFIYREIFQTNDTKCFTQGNNIKQIIKTMSVKIKQIKQITVSRTKNLIKSGKAFHKKHDLRRDLKEISDSADLISSGCSFHSFEALTASAPSPPVFSRASGTD